MADRESCVVRNCKLEEIPGLIELLKKTDLFWETGDKEEVFRKKLGFDQDSIMVLEYNGNVIGMVTIIYDPWASFIWHLAIDPEYQGRGLGHILAEEAERRLRSRGTTGVNGYVLPGNRNSRSFLKKRGYTDFSAGQVIAVEKPFKEGAAQ